MLSGNFFFSFSQVFFFFYRITRRAVATQNTSQEERERLFSSLTYNGDKLTTIQQSPPNSAWINLQRKTVPQIHTRTLRRTRQTLWPWHWEFICARSRQPRANSQLDVFDCWRSPALAQQASPLESQHKGTPTSIFQDWGLPLNASFEFFQGAKEDWRLKFVPALWMCSWLALDCGCFAECFFVSRLRRRRLRSRHARSQWRTRFYASSSEVEWFHLWTSKTNKLPLFLIRSPFNGTRGSLFISAKVRTYSVCPCSCAACCPSAEPADRARRSRRRRAPPGCLSAPPTGSWFPLWTGIWGRRQSCTAPARESTASALPSCLSAPAPGTERNKTK